MKAFIFFRNAGLFEIPGKDRMSVQVSGVKFSTKYSKHLFATFAIFSWEATRYTFLTIVSFTSNLEKKMIALDYKRNWFKFGFGQEKTNNDKTRIRESLLLTSSTHSLYFKNPSIGY